MELLTRLERSIQGVIRGKDEALRLSLVALFARGHPSLAWHFCEIDAQVEFVTQGFSDAGCAGRRDRLPILETLALVEPTLLF